MLAEPPEMAEPAFRKHLYVVPPPTSSQPALTLKNARLQITEALEQYLNERLPAHLLLIRASPGVGKSRSGVRAAEVQATLGQRVLYAGPRHALYQTVLAEAAQPALWREWLPRRGASPAGPATCRYPDEITTWLKNGYEGTAFCAGVCGWTYVKEECPWHAQQRLTEPIVFGQHAHVIAHPQQFHAVIGDEFPMSAFLHPWSIPVQHVLPIGMDPTSALTHLVHALALLAQRATGGQAWSGPTLLAALGGADQVLEACQEFAADRDVAPLAPTIRQASDVADIGPFHLPALVDLLRREAEAHLAGQAYPARILVEHSQLTLLLRRAPNNRLPLHVIWLDGTGNERLYAALFRRPIRAVDAAPALHGRIFQVTNRAHGVGTLVSGQGNLRAAAVKQLQVQVRSIADRYDRPAVISHQAVVADLAGALERLHFYAARGTNDLVRCDALIVAGTPMPPADSLVRQAAMLFPERMTAFDTRWSERILPYAYVDPADGQGRAYPVNGYWHDPDLQAVLWAYREAEIIQAAHRARPIGRDVDVWLLTNLPLPELPPTRLLSLRELCAAPEGVAPARWAEVMAYAQRTAAAAGCVTTVDLMQQFSLHRTTAYKYLDLLVTALGWERAAAPQRRGRPIRSARLPSSVAPTH